MSRSKGGLDPHSDTSSVLVPVSAIWDAVSRDGRVKASYGISREFSFSDNCYIYVVLVECMPQVVQLITKATGISHQQFESCWRIRVTQCCHHSLSLVSWHDSCIKLGLGHNSDVYIVVRDSVDKFSKFVC